VIHSVPPGYVQDGVPAPITSDPALHFSRDGFAHVAQGEVLQAVCWTNGVELTDGNNSWAGDDPWQFTSTLVYGVVLADGRFGYIHSVWTTKQNNTFGLRNCADPVPAPPPPPPPPEVPVGGNENGPPTPTFYDVTGVHAVAVASVAAAGIASGYPDGTFRPSAPVSRAQMATFLARALQLNTGGTAWFGDVFGDPHLPNICAVVAAGIAGGYPDGTFRPSDSVSRGQMASFLARALLLPSGGSAPFPDVQGGPHATNIGAAVAAGLTAGYPDGTFRPDAPVSRAQMATFLARAFGLPR
jgi:hypothetical protein